MKPYPAYKDSGIEWIGEIPEHWDIRKFTHIVSIQEGPGILAQDFEEIGIPLIRISGFDGEYVTKKGCNYLNPEKVNSKWNHFKLNKGDILISCSASTDLVAEVNDDVVGCIPYTGIIRLKPSGNNISKDYIRTFVKSTPYFIQIELLKAGSTIQHYGPTHLKNFRIILPSIEEQKDITNYVSKKTSLIDTLIEKKQKQIELLKEERTAIINQAVTKGLNPDVRMKDSGIEWLGEVPEHWETIKLKWLLKKIGSGITPKGGAEVYQEEGIPIIRSQNVHFEGLKLDDVAYISEEIHHSMIRSTVEPNDVLMNITGASIGRCTIVPEGFGEANVNQHVCILRPHLDVNSAYLHLVLSSDYGQLQVWASQNGAAREGLNYEQLGNFWIPLPSVTEQEDIVQEVRSNTDIIFHSINLIDKQITHLQEYRTALISNAVTGKIDVRDTPTAIIE